jgi:hypothetical protein
MKTVNSYFVPLGHKASTWVMPQGHKSSHNRFAPRLMPQGHNSSTWVIPLRHKSKQLRNLANFTYNLIFIGKKNKYERFL